MSRSQSRVRRLLQPGDEDPLSGIANLFDAAMVFAVALLIAFAAQTGRLPKGSRAKGQEQEVPLKNRRTLKHFRASARKARGRGKRLGVAFRLESGEVVYVPETRSAEEAGR